MATLGFTNITTALAPNGTLPVAYGEDGLVLEVFRVSGAGGGTVGDTATLVPQFMSDVRTLQSQHATTNALSSSSANTQAVITLKASIPTNEVFDVWLLGRR